MRAATGEHGRMFVKLRDDEVILSISEDGTSLRFLSSNSSNQIVIREVDGIEDMASL